MSKEQNLYQPSLFANAVIDQNWGMDQLSNSRAASTGAPMYANLARRSKWFRRAFPNRSAESGKFAHE
jgi:hypothetical protein